MSGCRCNTPVDNGSDRVHFESSKFRQLNELDCLEQTIAKRQQELHEMEEVLERHRINLAAVQMEVALRFTCLHQYYLLVFLFGMLFDMVLLHLLITNIVHLTRCILTLTLCLPDQDKS